MDNITLDTVTAENVGSLSTVELIDLIYEQMYRVQTETMKRFFVNEPLLPTYDAKRWYNQETKEPCAYLDPHTMALEAELLKRFEPLRSRLSKKDKAHITRTIKELGFIGLLHFTGDDAESFLLNVNLVGHRGRRLYETSQAVLTLLLEGESIQAYKATRQKYTLLHQQREARRSAEVGITAGT